METIAIEELKSEKSPRISAEDLIELCELAGPTTTRSPSKKSVKSKPKILIIDVRSPDEYPLLRSLYDNRSSNLKERAGKCGKFTVIKKNIGT